MFILVELPYFSLSQKRPDVKKNVKVYFCDSFMMASLVAKAGGLLSDSFRYAKEKYLAPDFGPKLAELLTGSLLKRYFGAHLFYGVDKKKEIDKG